MTAGILFLINTLFRLFLFCVLIRIIGQWVGLDYNSPLAQLTSKLTNWAIMPLRSLLPRFRRFDLAGWLVAYLSVVLKTLLLILIHYHAVPAPLGLLASGIPVLLSGLLDLYFYLIIITAICSWVPQLQSSSIMDIQKLCEPLLRPIARLLPNVAGFDLSPLVLLILLKLTSYIIVNPMIALTMKLF